MRVGLVLAPGSGEDDRLASLRAQASALESFGLPLAWLEEGGRGGPPLITAAALSTVTTSLRMVTCVSAVDHPLATAEAVVVADNCTNGRIVLALDGDDAELLGEAADAVLAATTARPFRHAGRRWTIPANRPENDGACEQIVVTPQLVQPELSLWLAGSAGPVAAAQRGLPFVARGDQDPASLWAQAERAGGAALRHRSRPGIYALDLEHGGTFDADELIGELRDAQAQWGMDAVLLRPPVAATTDARVKAIARLASFVVPRVIQVPLPGGLEADWDAHLAERVRTMRPA